MPENGWSRHELLVLTSLAELKHDVKEIKEDVASVRTDIAMLKVKSGMWGAAAGFVPALIVMGAVLVRGI